MKVISNALLIKMIQYGSKKISDYFEYINELNVFPVPDGDTGTNMKICIAGAFEAVKCFSSNDIYDSSRLFSRQLLLNARGNSGVIFLKFLEVFLNLWKKDKQKLK